MVGRSVLLRVDKAPAAPKAPVLEVEGLSVVDGQGVRRVKDVSFDVRAGEIVGIAGVAGNGQSELLEALAGIRSGHGARSRSRAGHSTWPPSPTRRCSGSAASPTCRRTASAWGCVTAFTAYENNCLGYQGRSRLHPWRRQGDRAAGLHGLRRHPAGREVQDHRLRRAPAQLLPEGGRASRAATSRRSCWRARSSATRHCCSSASRPAASTSARSSSSTAA